MYYDDYHQYDEPSKFERAMDQFAATLSEKMIGYGYDPEIVNEWFATAGENW